MSEVDLVALLESLRARQMAAHRLAGRLRAQADKVEAVLAMERGGCDLRENQQTAAARRRSVIVDFLRAKGPTRTKRLAQLVATPSRSTVNNDLKALDRAGKIRQVRRGWWAAVDSTGSAN